jgi:predicted transcriptional regulator
LRKRSDILIRAEILRVLYDGPTGPTRLSRLCNVPYDRLETYISPLLLRGLVDYEVEGDKAIYSLTPDGLKLLHEIEEVLSKLKP